LTQIADTLNTTVLMSASASFMGLLGVGAALLPEQILAYLGTPPEGFPVVLLNVVGVVYLSFGVLNWMARKKLIGGIYSRPVAIGNFAHFFGVTVALTQHVTAAPHPTVFVVGTAAYALFAAGFGYVVFAGGQSCG
jgi:hypothetical protein